jgi:serine/threonine protein phosphatase 1
VTIYAIGDIHGRSDCLRRVHDLIDRDKARPGARGRPVEIYLGDYVDRGPDSQGVIELLIERSRAVEARCLLGNHELILASFLRGEMAFDEWRSMGGLETVLSYGVRARELLQQRGVIAPSDLAERFPASHRSFISGLLPYVLLGDYGFVHAGVRPGAPIEKQAIEDLAWIRESFLSYHGDFGKIVVHGHTPVSAVEFLPNRINIDTGAYATNRLSVLRIDADGPLALEAA